MMAFDLSLSNPGRYFATGSSRRSFPSSASICTATPVSGLVIERMLKIVSRSMARLSSRSRAP